MAVVEEITDVEQIRPVVHPLNLHETTSLNEDDRLRKKGLLQRALHKLTGTKKRGTPTGDNDSPFNLLAPRSFAEESKNPLVRQFSRVRDVYANEMDDTPRCTDAKPINEMKWHEPEYWQYRKQKLGKQVQFVRKLVKNDFQLILERAIAKDLRETLPEVHKGNKVGRLRHNALWARRIVTLENGSMVASANLDYTVTIYDLNCNNRKICTLENFSSHVLSLAWLGDDLLATGTGEGSINTWSVRTGELHTTIDLGMSDETDGSGELNRPAVTALVAMDTTKFIAGTSDGTLILYRHKKGREVREERRKEKVHDGWIWRIASYRHEILSVSEDCTCVLLIARTLKRVGRWRHKHAVTACALGRCYIVTDSHDTLRIRHRGDELSRVSLWRQVHGGGWVHSVILWDNDQLLSTGGDGQIVVFDLSSGTAKHRVDTTLNAVWDATLLPGQRVAVCGPWHPVNYVLNMERYLTEERSPRTSIWTPRSWILPNSVRNIDFVNPASLFSPK